MKVAEASGGRSSARGVDTVFGVVGSGNFARHQRDGGGGRPFVAARHEGGAATMADAYARMSGRVAAVTVHQGCGLTNAMTGITEAAKSRTPLSSWPPRRPQPRSNFYVDQAALARRSGRCRAGRRPPPTRRRAAAAVATAVRERRIVLLNLPLDVQAAGGGAGRRRQPPASPSAPPVDDDGVRRLADALRDRAPAGVRRRARRPGPGSRAALEALAERTGALLATSAVAKGLFDGNPWSLDVSGGFASPLAAELIAGPT